MSLFEESAICSISKLHLPSLGLYIVHAKSDYCNSLFLNIDNTQINRLQAVQNALTHAVTKTPQTPPHHSCSPSYNKCSVTLHYLSTPYYSNICIIVIISFYSTGEETATNDQTQAPVVLL